MTVASEQATTRKNAVRHACSAGSFPHVRDALIAFLKEHPGTAAAEFAAHQAALAAERLALPELRVAILASFTILPLAPHLTLRAVLGGSRLAFRDVPYDQWHESLNTGVALDDFRPDLVLVLLHLEDVAPLLARRHLAARDHLGEEADRLIASMHGAVAAFRRRAAAPVAFATFIAAQRGIERHFDRTATPSRQEGIDALNRRLGEVAAQVPGTYVFDYAGTVTDFGRHQWFDAVKGHQYGTSVSAAALPVLAAELIGFLESVRRPRQKVLALDLDNTVWGGVVGEDGPDGIAVAGAYPGNAYADFHALLSNLRAAGVALAAASKNNEADVQEAFSRNPGMTIGLKDFAAQRINWDDKVTNLASIAEELNVGLDAVTFADDSPFETGLVRAQAPHVRVVDLDGPPSLFGRHLLEEGGFYSASLTAEDLGRADTFEQDAVRRTGLLRSGAGRETFLAAMGLKMELGPMRATEVERVAQLFAKTNQFNLTTPRHSAGRVQELMAAPGNEIHVVRLDDRFGSYGLVGVIHTRDTTDSTREIEAFLLSCRILGRNVEEAAFAFLDERSRARGIKRLRGRYLATKKNGQVADLYPRFGFGATAVSGVFERDLASLAPLPFPEHIQILRR